MQGRPLGGVEAEKEDSLNIQIVSAAAVEGGDLAWAGSSSYLCCFSGKQIQKRTEAKLLP